MTSTSVSNVQLLQNILRINKQQQKVNYLREVNTHFCKEFPKNHPNDQMKRVPAKS